MSGSLKSCFKKLSDVLRIVNDGRASKKYKRLMGLPKLQETEQRGCYSKAKEAERFSGRPKKVQSNRKNLTQRERNCATLKKDEEKHDYRTSEPGSYLWI